MNQIYIIYQGESDSYTIEDEFLAYEVDAIMKDDEVTFAIVNDNKIK